MKLGRKTKQTLLILFILAMLANFLLSGYIHYAKILGEQGLSAGGSCFASDGDIGSCLQVQLSTYSTILGIPLSIYGMVFFLIIFALLFGVYYESSNTSLGKIAKKYSNQIKTGLVLLFVWGGAFSLWLLYLQFFVIGQLCLFCLWIDGITLSSAILFLWLFSKQVFD